MNEHPYWTVLAISTGLITLGVLVLLYCLTGWAWTKWRTARDQRQWAKSTRIDWDAAHRRLYADG